ncbi:hypothetical protein Tco_1264943 [Tanacetum coccineum]
MHAEHHEKQTESILNYLEEPSFHCIEKMKERFVNNWIIMPSIQLNLGTRRIKKPTKKSVANSSIVQRSLHQSEAKALDTSIGNRVMLKASPRKDIFRFGKRGKLNPRYIGPFKILERIDPVAYKLELPKKLSSIHISNLKKCLSDESFIIPIKEL